MISAIARAKINLYLHVLGKRPDGYHLLESLVVFAEGGDEITAESAGDLSLTVAGPFAEMVGSMDDNLVLKAARLLQSESGSKQGARIKLVKNLPVAAGIGGGSADSAETLKLLNQLWNLEYSDRELAALGLSLGADVPVCLFGKPAIMSGIGEELRPIISFPEIYILLVNLGKMVSTIDVFKRLRIPHSTPNDVSIERQTAARIFTALRETRNDLEIPAREILPEIGEVLAKIEEQEGCRLSRMSGSGATCFGLFENKDAADKAAQRLKEGHPDWWVQAFSIDQ